MPSYNMKNKATGEVRTMILSLREREELLEAGEWTQLLSTPNFVSQMKGTVAQAGDGWKDVLGKIKSGAGRGNTINN